MTIADRGYFQKLRDNPQAGITFSEPLVARTNGRPSFTVSRALRDGQGVFHGAVVALIDVDYIEKFFQSLNVGAHGAISVYRSDDFTPVVRWPQAAGGKPLPPGTPTREAVASGQKSGTLEYVARVDGIRRIYSFRALDPYPFYVGVGFATDDVLATWKARSLSVGLISALLLGLLILSLLRWSRADAARAELAAIVENSNDAIYSVDGGGNIVTWNTGAEKMFGYRADEAIGKPVVFLLPPQDAPIAAETHARSDEGATAESRRMAKDGRVIEVQVNMSPTRDDSGHVSGASVIVQDITARKRAHTALRERDELLQTLTHHAQVGVAMVSADHRYAYVNAAYAGALGLAIGDINGKRVQDVLGPAYDREIRPQLERAFAGEHVAYELALPRNDSAGKPERHFSATYNPSVDTPHGPCVIVVVVDVTARKQADDARSALEAQLGESHKLQAVGTLAGGIAHEFNNVISTVLGNVELARQDAGGNLELLRSLQEVQQAGLRARDLVQQLLTFSRRHKTERKVISLTPVVDATARLLRASLPARVTLHTHCDPDTPPVQADADQIRQALVNLATNAMQAIVGVGNRGNGTGAITIRLDSVVLDAALALAQPALDALHARQPGRTVRLAVSDDGPGMDAATLARAFEPFFTTKPVNGGTGLGLSAAHGIVQGHDGAIVLESAPGKGTTATLYLPQAAAAPEAPVPAPTDAASAAPAAPWSPRLMHIDDDPMPLSLYKRFFERRGYRVSSYTDARAALDTLRADPASVDLVVTDYNMPVLTGLAVAREVRAIRADLPVAVLSGFIDEILVAQADEAGVRELISKAESVDTIFAKVERLVRGQGATATPPDPQTEP